MRLCGWRCATRHKKKCICKMNLFPWLGGLFCILHNTFSTFVICMTSLLRNYRDTTRIERPNQPTTTMQLHSSLLVLSLLFASLLSIATAYPAPPNPGIQTSAGSRSSSSGSTTGSRVPPKNPKHHGEGSSSEEEQTHSETGGEFHSGGGGEGGGNGVEGGDSGKCRVPLSTEFASKFKDGHGCKKIAEAFGNCDVTICQEVGVRENCLCNQSKIFNDDLVKSCHAFLNKQDLLTARLVEPYLGLCRV